MIYADLADMQRLNGWTETETSMFEIALSDECRDAESMEAVTRRISDILYRYKAEEDDQLLAVSSADRFAQIFDWIELIDFNVLFVLILMIAVAAVNMMTGLLIMLFENISTIGLFKSLGMRDRNIMNVFMTRAAGTVLKGMLIGNAVAFAFCFIQDKTHLISLDPVNYFVSYVPVHLNFMPILLADVVAYAAILLLMQIPCAFISRIDPAQTMRME
jgi:lipoprotein-releasing system permease protein